MEKKKIRIIGTFVLVGSLIFWGWILSFLLTGTPIEYWVLLATALGSIVDSSSLLAIIIHEKTLWALAPPTHLDRSMEKVREAVSKIENLSDKIVRLEEARTNSLEIKSEINREIKSAKEKIEIAKKQFVSYRKLLLDGIQSYMENQGIEVDEL